MASVRIGHSGAITLENLERGKRGSIDSVLVSVNLQGLKASQRVWTINDFYDLVRFFGDLAEHWQGWTGTKSFESLEGDLRMSAQHDGHVLLAFEVSQTSVARGWSMAGELVLDPGDELTKIAQEIELLFSPTD